jgi:MFS family permease
MISGVFGAAANLGLILLAVLNYLEPITVEHWRWAFLVAASPIFIAIIIFAWMPESPAWLAHRDTLPLTNAAEGTAYELFRPPLLRYTILGFC